MCAGRRQDYLLLKITTKNQRIPVHTDPLSLQQPYRHRHTSQRDATTSILAACANPSLLLLQPVQTLHCCRSAPALVAHACWPRSEVTVKFILEKSDGEQQEQRGSAALGREHQGRQHAQQCTAALSCSPRTVAQHVHLAATTLRCASATVSVGF